MSNKDAMAIAEISETPELKALRRCMESAGRIVSGAHQRALAVHRRRLSSSTSYETAEVTAEFDDGRSLQAFVKDYGYSVRPKDEPQQRRDREMLFYRDLLPDGALGSPRYYGSVWENGHHWLVLEFVQGQPVKYCEFDYWVAAAGWLGRMHGHFYKQLDRLEACDFLERQDGEFFRSRAENAIAAVGTVSTEFAERLTTALRGYDAAINAMLRGPRTLLHGGYHSRNVLVKIEGAPDRICVIDWEEVGFGAPLSDLGYFVNGFEEPRLGQLLDAYCASASAYELPLFDRAEMIHIMKCFRLHKLLQSLPKYSRWNQPQATLLKLVTLAETYASEVR